MQVSMQEARKILTEAQAKGIDPSLEPVRAMLNELGSPDERYDAIQVVGTNGKTSTARYVASILRGEGLRVGLFLSPCLVDYTDQIEVDGQVVGEREFAQAVMDVAEAGAAVNRARVRRGEKPLPNTEFDLLAVAALLIFARQEVDVAVLEAGMGGKWDATSAARSICEVGVTGIGLDHTRFLGDTLAQIAEQKAAVIKRGRCCVLGPGVFEDESVGDVFLSRCHDQQVEPVKVVPHASRGKLCDWDGLASFDVVAAPRRLGDPLCLCVQTKRARYQQISAPKPTYQAPNIACAVVMAEEYVGRPLKEDALADSVYGCRTPGRFDVVREDPLVLLDACHNPQSVAAFLSALDAIEPCVQRRPTLLCAIFADKDVDKMVRLLSKAFLRVVVTKTSSPRAMDSHELASVFARYGQEPVGVYECVGEAVQFLAGEPFVACGSITTAGEALQAISSMAKGERNVRA